MISLTGGNVIAQMISVGIIPITTRLFTPENFGLFALFAAGTSVFSSISSLCYERAIILPEKSEDAINLLFLSLLILIISTPLLYLFFFSLRNEIAELLGNSDFSTWILVIPIAVFFTGIVKIFRIWHLRNRHFKGVAIARGCESAASALFKVCIGFFVGAYSWGLIGGAIVGTVIATIILIWKPEGFNFAQEVKKISKKSTIELSKRYKNFPYYASWNALLNFVSQNMFIFMFSAFFTPAIVGFYSLGNRALQQPISMFSQSFHNAYLQKSAYQLTNKVPMIPGLKKTIIYLFCIGFIPFAILMVFGKIIFGTVFGENWINAGVYVQVLAPWFLMIFISSPAKVIYEVCQKQGVKLILNVSSAVFRVAAILVGYYLSKDPLIVLISFVIVNVIFEFINIVVAIFLTSNVDKWISKTI